MFIEAVPDRAMMERFRNDLDFPLMANIIHGGQTEEISANDLAQMGYSAVVYPFALIGAAIQGVRTALENLKASFGSQTPFKTLSAVDIMDAVGFPLYYEEEERYQYGGKLNGANGHQWD